jgi:predicted nucleotide-binding protein
VHEVAAVITCAKRHVYNRSTVADLFQNIDASLATVHGECFDVEFQREQDAPPHGALYLFCVTDRVRRRGSRKVSVERYGPKDWFAADYDARIERVVLNLIRRAFDSGQISFDLPGDPTYFKKIQVERSDFQRSSSVSDGEIRQLIIHSAYWNSYRGRHGRRYSIQFDSEIDLDYLGVQSEDVRRNQWILEEEGFLEKSNIPGVGRPTLALVKNYEAKELTTVQTLLSASENVNKRLLKEEKMTYYHAQIVLKDKDVEDLFEYDLSKEYARDKIAKKFISEQPFLFGGASVKPGAVERLRIVKTEKRADEVAKASVADYRRNRVNIGHNMAKERIVSHVKDSADVTREMFDEAQPRGDDGEGVSSITETNARGPLGGTIFIGHGRSQAWRDLKDFIAERLKLHWDEFNREAAAGLSTKERLQAMLRKARFAFLVMTAEDEHPTGALHARENVIHELGLFQGHLGFERAIILLEEGCAEFSNIHGLTQIRFSKGNIKAVFEEIRRVLEREGTIIKS